jgi:hypothetical protein
VDRGIGLSSIFRGKKNCGLWHRPTVCNIKYVVQQFLDSCRGYLPVEFCDQQKCSQQDQDPRANQAIVG